MSARAVSRGKRNDECAGKSWAACAIGYQGKGLQRACFSCNTLGESRQGTRPPFYVQSTRRALATAGPTERQRSHPLLVQLRLLMRRDSRLQEVKLQEERRPCPARLSSHHLERVPGAALRRVIWPPRALCSGCLASERNRSICAVFHSS